MIEQTEKLYPMKTEPVYKDYLWGGNKLKELYGKTSDADIMAESWEASAHPAGESKIANGYFAGKTINEVIKILGKDFLGSEEEFSLLFKLIDARDRLSVQVHPDDEYAFKFENGSKGKTELWYVISAEDNAKLIYGFKDNIEKSDFEKAIENGELEGLLNSVTVSEGDVFFIPAGTIHGIGSGIVVAEIQENSDLTYRVFDYNRRDKNGNVRQLHTEKALEVTALNGCSGREVTPGREFWNNSTKIKKVINCEHFKVNIYDAKKEIKLETTKCAQIMFILSGSGSIFYNDTEENFSMGDTFLIPAQMGEYTIKGACRIILCEKGDKPDIRTPKILKSSENNVSRFKIREDLLGGQKGEYPYSYIKVKSGVVVLPFWKGKIVTIRQYRHAFEDFLYELPAGVIDEGETPDETALRELFEETGYKAEKAEYLGCFYPSPGATDEVIYLFSAKCTECAAATPEDSEQIDVHLVEESEFAQMVLKDKFLHGGALAAYLKYKLCHGDTDNL